MPTPDEATARIETARRAALELLDGQARRCAEWELPARPPAAESARQKLAANAYQVLVAGEAKRGKSSFVNALVGRDLLPTDVDVATCQVFRVRAADRPAYRLRFEDDTTREIAAEELARYGSQGTADRAGTPVLENVLRWVEVDLPVRFLPPGVALLDTPGLGSLYAGHAEVTNRFVPHADAVVFVLDSGQPVTRPELEFLADILKVTRNVFFVQTKIDAHRRQEWEAVLKRNQQLLAERFGAELPAARVWPFSSTNLRRAEQTGDDAYLAVSRQRELAVALRQFLFRSTGWGRLVDALAGAEFHHHTARQSLSGRLAGLTAEGGGRAALQQAVRRRREQFEAEWGGRGQKRQNLLDAVRKEIALTEQYLDQALRPGGDVEAALRARVDAAQSADEVWAVYDAIPVELAAAAGALWRQAFDRARRRCAALLTPFLAEAESFAVWPPDDVPALAAGDGRTGRNLLLEIYPAARTDVAGATSLVGVPLGILALAGVVAGPVALAGVAAAAVWGLFHGTRTVLRGRVKTARQDCHKLLAENLTRVRQHFFNVDHVEGTAGRVKRACAAAVRAVEDQVTEVVARKGAEVEADVARVEEQAALDARQRQARADELRGQLAEWDALGRGLTALLNEVKSFSAAPTPAAAPADPSAVPVGSPA